MSEEIQPLSLFIAYAREDKELRDELEKHLKHFERRGIIKIWHDRHIDAGKEWKKEIQLQLEKADIILLLVTPDSISSDYFYEKEMIRAVERHNNADAVVIPVILRPVNWSETKLGELQALPEDKTPVTSWESRDEAFLNIEKGVGAVIENLKKNKRFQQKSTKGFEESIDSSKPNSSVSPPQSKLRIKRSILLLSLLSLFSLLTILTIRIVMVDRKMCPVPIAHKVNFDFDSEKVDFTPTSILMVNRRYELEVNSFSIDKFEVTNRQYKSFIDATGHPSPPSWLDGNFPSDKAFHPASSVSWDDANSYCKWQGKRLPTEVEWERACEQDRDSLYPWGDTPNSSLANIKDSTCGETLAVGSYQNRKKHKYEIYDMIGNVNEWTNSSFGNLSEIEGIESVENISTPTIIIRGGSYDFNASCESRLEGPKNRKSPNVGFRCVED